jgi:hypothetical protein
MEDLLWLLFVVFAAGVIGAMALAFVAVAAPVAATCVFGAAAHAFLLTMSRAIVHRGGTGAARGADEPAFCPYYRSQVWRDLRTAAVTASKHAREETARIKALVPPRDKWYLAVFRVILVVYAYAGLAIGALLGVIAGLVPALVIALVAGGAWAVGVPLRGLERLRRQRRGTHFDCSECHERFPLPVYACPNCGAKHRQLAPGPLGVMRHRCICGARLPALQSLGRERLTSQCPTHGHPLGEGVGTVRTFHVPVAGGPSAGKSTFLAAAMLGLEQAAAQGTLSTTVQSSSRDGYDRLLDGFRRGVLPTKTVDLQAPAVVAEIRGQDASALLYAYDVAGEAYGDDHELRRDPGYGLAAGVVLLVDPFALTRVRSELGDELEASPQLRPSPEAPQRVLERLVGVLDEKGIDMSAIRATICVTKRDGLGIGAAVDASPGDDDDARVRAWLEAQGAGNLLRSAQGTFKEIRCFSVSALGRSPGAGTGPFTPSGALEPLLWLLARVGVEPAVGGDARETQTQRLTSAEPLDLTPRRPPFTEPIDAAKTWPLAGNFVLGLLLFGVLSLVTLPATLFVGVGSAGGSGDAALGRTDIAAAPPVAPVAPPAAPAGNPPPQTHGGSPNSPSRVLRRHFERLASGDYDGAFTLMSSRYRAANPNWADQPRRARPYINVAAIGPSKVGSRVAFVYIKFYGRDSRDTARSDTTCRRFTGEARLIKEGSRWRYDPGRTQLTSAILPSSLDVCTH